MRARRYPALGGGPQDFDGVGAPHTFPAFADLHANSFPRQRSPDENHWRIDGASDRFAAGCHALDIYIDEVVGQTVARP